MKYLILILSLFVMTGCTHIKDTFDIDYSDKAAFISSLDQELGRYKLPTKIQNSVRKRAIPVFDKYQDLVVDHTEMKGLVKSIIAKELGL